MKEMTVCEKIIALRNALPEYAQIINSVVDDLRSSVTAIIEGIEEGRTEDALGCCEDII